MHENYIKDTLSGGSEGCKEDRSKAPGKAGDCGPGWRLALSGLACPYHDIGEHANHRTGLAPTPGQGTHVGEEWQPRAMLRRRGQLLVISSQHYHSWGTGALSRDAEQSGAPRVHDIS